MFEELSREWNARNQAQMNGREYQIQPIELDEPFYKDETMAEIGYCWENQVFGGNVMWSRKASDPLFVSKWPNFFTDGDHPTRAKQKHTARRYIVSSHFVKNLHRQAFWDNVRPGDETALYIKKTVGID